MFEGGVFAHPGIQAGPLRFYLSRNDLRVRDGTGKLTGAALGAPLWAAECEVTAIRDDDALDIEMLIQAAQGSMEQFIVSDPRRWYPKAYRKTAMSGLTVTASSFSVDGAGTGLTLNGLTPGTVIDATSLVGFKGGAGLTKRHAVGVVTGGTVGGGGAVVLTVDPAVWPVVQAWSGVVAHLDKPSVSMKLTTGTTVGATSPEGQSTNQLVALQYLWD